MNTPALTVLDLSLLDRGPVAADRSRDDLPAARR